MLRISPESFGVQDEIPVCALTTMLHPLYETLSGIHSRTYLPLDRAQAALHLLIAVANELLPTMQSPGNGMNVHSLYCQNMT